MYDQQKIDDFIFWAEDLIKSHDKDMAFLIICAEIDNCEDRYLNEYITVLNFMRGERIFDWMERNADRIKNVNSNWGHLAASSYFSWWTADKWLTKGRPLSLIALDAILFCTTTGERLNQSLWMRQNQPTLLDHPGPDVIARRLQEYLQTDNVPRTRHAVHKIIDNIFDVKD